MMNEKIMEILMNKYNENEEKIKCLSADDERNKDLLNEQKDIREQMVKLAQNERDAEVKEKQIEAENKRDNKHFWFEVGKTGTGYLLMIWLAQESFRFDKDYTLTSTIGRPFISKIIPQFPKLF